MKRNNILIALLVFGWTILISQPIFAVATKTSKRAEINVMGMVCDFCTRGISKKLKKDTRVKRYTIDLNNKTVTVYFKKDQAISKKDLAEIMKQSGYTVKSIQYYEQKN
ncbi:MAG TPA: hypothetical protein DCL40_00685 [Coxiellaceae bacterium]|nr:hypothetical protein [Coxiellaceae bacterium]|tara:strand:+ start:146 stop:472 length:327 start_codon:yes stop_codon:yes gene_type:complete